MSNNKKSVAIAVGATLAGSLALTGSAFAMQPLAQGYMLSGDQTATAGHDHKAKDGEKAHTMASMDTDKDGKMSKAEFAAAHEGSNEKFAAHDTDGDGFITTAEMDAHHAAGKKNVEGKCGEGKCGEGKRGGNK